MDSAAPAARSDQGQRVGAAVDRGGVPRLGADPRAALHRRKPASASAPQETWRRHAEPRPAGPVMYAALRRAMFLVPPERIHHLVFAGLRDATTPRFARHSLARKYSDYDPALTSTVFGVRFPAPLGLAAGFDKDGQGAHTWGALGFGHAEVGTVTPRPQPGNPAPRLFRLPEDRALLNRMGFNNHGASALVRTLARASPQVPIGVNIGKNKTTPPEQAVDDYADCARLLGPLCAYLVVNVSSPNTPGLRDLQSVESLRPILTAVVAATSRPVLVKIAPDLADDDV